MKPARRGFSLLEIILAMSVLFGSLVVLGHLAWLGRRHIEAAAELSDAQRICSTRLQEILVGVVPLKPVEDEPLDGDPGWLCSVEVEPLHERGLSELRVTVVEDLPDRDDSQKARRFSLVRWIRDPEAAEEEPSLEGPLRRLGGGRP